ncbi:MAG: AAA family ATPase [Actinobacteria bacterium]|nr:AAA family ATPase [Actinomycetota bacterium]
MDTRAPDLIGRTAELHRLRQALERTTDGATEVAVITGEAGIGKTALARVICDEASARGARVAWASCWYLDESPSYWPWRRVLGALGGAAEVVAAIHSGLGPPEVFERLETHLRQSSTDAPIVVVLDDAHGADEATLSLAAICARTLRTTPMLFLLTVCEEDVPNQSRRARLLDSVGRSADRIDLFGLSENETLDYFEQLNGERPPSLVGSGVYSATEGNPFFVEQVARELVTTGDIRRPDHSLGFKLPRGAHALVERLLQRLTPEANDLLAEASVLGRRFTAPLLAKLTSSEDPSSLIDQAADRGVIRAVDSLGGYEFAHALLREALYEGLSSEARAQLHLRAAELLSSLDIDRNLFDIAHHRFKAGLAGDVSLAIETLVAAAERALRLGSDDEATRHRFRALQLVAAAGLPSSTVERLEVPSADPLAPAPSAQTEASFRREGEFWTITYGPTTSRLKDSRGMHILLHLLREPNREFHALDLSGGGGKKAAQSDTGPLIDGRARAQYAQRLEEIEEEIAEADAMNDLVRRERAESEKAFLVDELRAAVGLGGRARRSGSDSERARVALTRAVRSALRRIAAADPALGEHLDRAIRTGTFLSYDPDPNATPNWTF